MTKAELIERLNELAVRDGDIENDHVTADNLLIKFINDEEIKEAFAAVPKWYA